MAEVINKIGESITSVYTSFMGMIPSWAQDFLTLFLLVVVITAYAIFIWKFYRFIAHKNILGLNLNKYNKSQHPFVEKLFAGSLYFIEYIIILPFLIFFWFGVFTLFLIFLTEGIEVKSILIISATIIAAIRMISYYNEDLSKDLAKLLPFTLLAITITKPGFFDFEQILSHFSQLSAFFNQILFYLIFIIILEVILRAFDFIISLFGLETPKLEKNEDKKEK